MSLPDDKMVVNLLVDPALGVGPELGGDGATAVHDEAGGHSLVADEVDQREAESGVGRALVVEGFADVDVVVRVLGQQGEVMAGGGGQSRVDGAKGSLVVWLDRGGSLGRVVTRVPACTNKK